LCKKPAHRYVQFRLFVVVLLSGLLWSASLRAFLFFFSCERSFLATESLPVGPLGVVVPRRSFPFPHTPPRSFLFVLEHTQKSLTAPTLGTSVMPPGLRQLAPPRSSAPSLSRYKVMLDYCPSPQRMLNTSDVLHVTTFTLAGCYLQDDARTRLNCAGTPALRCLVIDSSGLILSCRSVCSSCSPYPAGRARVWQHQNRNPSLILCHLSPVSICLCPSFADLESQRRICAGTRLD
jgi:hypothetical protein